MPASFVRLRIVGFKSFAEPIVVELLPGLTGVVGPNGCGKSNVVEALRWAMGENSARSLRGGEMDDVIFAGTAHRPRRDIAEVTLWLTDTEGIAPPPFHREPELQISRRIEREAGSVYRVNGREARARDVQTLFADLATGARSSAMVSQGRVAAVVAASPAERRTILEEAAGITGLHARRHEAELKLRATEANLARAADLGGQVAVQLEGLKRQAKQAERFRTIGEAVTEAERQLLAVQQAAAVAASRAADATLAAARQAVTAGAAAAVAAEAAAQRAGAAVLPARDSEAAARTTLERARIEAERAGAEAAETQRALEVARQRAAQVARDRSHAESLVRDAATATERLDREAAELAEQEAAHPGALEAARSDATAACAALDAAEAIAERAAEQSAGLLARHRAATDLHAAADKQARTTAARVAQFGEEAARARAQLVPTPTLEEAAAARERAAAALHRTTVVADEADAARRDAQAKVETARAEAAGAAAAKSRLAATAQGVADALATGAPSGGVRLADTLLVPPGLEAAVAAALGEGLDSALGGDDARHWIELPALDGAALPEGVGALADDVGAPAALDRALGRIGMVEACSPQLQASLQPGQILVSRAGDAWRWDGHIVRAGAPNAAAVRLQQRNRLAGLRAELAEAERDERLAAAARLAAEALDLRVRDAEVAARTARRAAEQEAERSRAVLESLRARHAATAAKLASAEEQLARAASDRDAAAATLAEAGAALAALGDPASVREALERARATRFEARGREAAATARLQALQRAEASRVLRERGLSAERADWAARASDARDRATDLAARAEEVQADLARSTTAPQRAEARRRAATDTLSAAETFHRQAASAQQTAEMEAGAFDKVARSADAGLAIAREALVRAEAAVAAAQSGLSAVAARLSERLGQEVVLPDPVAFGAEAEERARRRLERLVRERAELGPVNLRAEIEAAELGEQVATIERETAELTTAIAKLRGSIGHINREGRQRLGQIFHDIDQHFRILFERMFGGGRAHLALVGSDDPLLAGLEIYAQPPGKKLASLSLLSGGEQALAALSLIFAVFRCQPAPVCVLDEVDAPLDDANVGRFCALLDEMVRDTGTRFLVVTHHQLTMARMDRLYGVTMQERGVSRLLSVDLQRAAALVEPARMAAE